MTAVAECRYDIPEPWGLLMTLSRRAFTAGLVAFAPVARAEATAWGDIEAKAKGQTVYFNAWAGSDVINAYIGWAGEVLTQRYGVTLTHVKITDTGEVVKRVRDEVAAGKTDGSVDLVWINGENFRTMKNEHLLFGPFATSLPNFILVDTKGKPTTLVDFQEEVAGLESPWGMAQFTFFCDGTNVSDPPKSMAALAAFAQGHAGRVTYPAPPDFHGDTFLKQVLVETIADRNLLAKPVTPDDFRVATEPLFGFLDELHPSLWRGGKQFPKDQAQVTQMLADGEVLIGLSFNPNEPANLVAAGRLPETTIAWQNEAGSIANTHFVAIPVNATAPAAAQVVANFLLSPEAQARKADLKTWGDPTVLDMSKLSDVEAKAFAAQAAPGSVLKPAPALAEPHAAWVKQLETVWLEKYGSG
jgi:putative thiamine transport system substrate-binding protein